MPYPSHNGLSIVQIQQVSSLVQVDLEKPRNLIGHESEECENGETREGVVVYPTLLQIHYSHMVDEKQAQGLGAFSEQGKRKKKT